MWREAVFDLNPHCQILSKVVRKPGPVLGICDMSVQEWFKRGVKGSKA